MFYIYIYIYIYISPIDSIMQLSAQEEPVEDIKGPSTLATLFNHKWPRFCGGDIYSRKKKLF